MTIAELLKKIPTRQLLDWLQWSRVSGDGTYWPSTNTFHTQARLLYNLAPDGISAELLKAELATREHVPNKHEAREIRRERAKRGR